MHLSGCGRVGFLRVSRSRIAVLLLISILLGSSLAGVSILLGSHSSAIPARGSSNSGATPAAGSSSPIIYSFSAFPSEILQGSSTSFSVGAYSPIFDPISYSFSGLPAGCVSSDTSFLFCAPTATGYYNVTVTATDTVTLAFSAAYTPLSVDPVVNDTLFSLQTNVISPFDVNFTEFGLPFGATWYVTLGSVLQGSTGFGLQFKELDGANAYSIPDAAGLAPSPQYGNVSVNGGNLDITISFLPPPLIPVFFNESCFFFCPLPSGTKWSVTLNGTTQTTTGTSIEFFMPAGSYSYTVNPVNSYSPSSPTGVVLVSPPFPSTVAVSFFYSGAPVYPVTFTETGLFFQAWSVLWNGVSVYTTTSSSMTIPAANGTYSFAPVSEPGYTVAPTSGSFTVIGPYSAPVSLVFTPQTTYTVTFNETGLPLVNPWSVTLNGSNSQASFSNQIFFSEPNANYSYTVSPMPGFVEAPISGFVNVNGTNPTPVNLTFTAQPTFNVTFNETGLPGGTPWSVTLNGTNTLSSGTNSIQFSVTNATYGYYVGSSAIGSVPGFSVSPDSGSVPVTGASVTVNVTYTLVSILGRVDSACSSINAPPFYQNFCYPAAQTPSLVTLANGTVGLGSELYTNATANVCAGAASSTVARVGLALSVTNGNSFGPSRPLGNDTCQYLNAIEPSFAASGSSVYGAFVEENSTAFAANYVARGTDALGFLRSTDNGTTFSPAVTLDSSGSIARPSIAAFGNTVYIVFEDIANSSTPLPGGPLPIAIEFMYSTNGGNTWSVPTTLPGLNSAEQYTAISPSVAVGTGGVLGVAYATDRRCVANISGSCVAYGDSIVDVTSNTNGTSWTGPTVLGTGGETLCYTGACYSGYFESTPQVSAAFSPNGLSLYVAYAATYDQGIPAASGNYNHTGVFVESDTGGVVSGGPVVALSGSTAVRSFNPGIGVSSSAVYLTYTQANESTGTSGLANSLSQWATASPIGSSLQWAPPAAVDVQSFISGGSVNTTRSSFPGFSASVGLSATGTPLIAFAFPLAPTTTLARGPSFYFVNTTYETDLIVGVLAVSGAPGALSITFSESGLPAGRMWQFSIDGIPYSLTTPSILVTNIPSGTPILISASYQPGYWEVVAGSFPQTTVSYTSNRTVTFAFEVWEGLEFNAIPSGLLPWLTTVCCFDTTAISANVFSTPFPAYVSATWEQYSQFPPIADSSIFYSGFDFTGNFSESWFTNCVQAACYYQTPWYFPLGTTLELYLSQSAYAQFAPIYWTGTGTGSYTGGMQGFCFDAFFCPASSGAITVLGPMNETLWFGNAPANLQSNITFSETGLPSTSVYHVTLDSSGLTGTASAPAVVPNLNPGAHTVSNIWANSSVPGWEYFGSVVGPNPFVSPVETQVPLSFSSFVNLSAPAGVVAFEATNLTAGTEWSIAFNDSTYSSSTPWINVTTRPGTFGISLDNAVSPAGTTGYVPANGTSPGSISVVPGRSYTIGYVPAYQLELLASPGGFVSVNGGVQQNQLTAWEPAGRVVSITATATSGYIFGGWSGTGAGSYTGTAASPLVTMNGPVVESATFIPLPGARFNLTFTASGLPAGTWWTVDMNGVGYSSDQSGFQVGQLWPWSAGASGHYHLDVPVAYLNGTSLMRYVPTPYPGVVGTNGSATPPVLIDYSPQVFVQLTETGSGTVEGTYQNSPLGSSGWVAQNGQVTISALPSPGSTFVGWQGTGSGSYTGSDASVTITASGPVSEVAVFTPVVVQPPARYSLTVQLTTPVASGTVWGITLGGVGYTSTSSSLTITGLAPGTYGMLVNTANAPSGLVQYRASTTDPVSYSVRANGTVQVSLDPYYWVQVSASVGGQVSPGSGYYAANSILYLVATANSSYAFAGWSGTGSGAYDGTNATASIIVTTPLTEVAQFHSHGAGAAASSIWSNPETWAGLGAVGMVLGIGVGVVFSRLSARPKGSATAPPTDGGVVR